MQPLRGVAVVALLALAVAAPSAVAHGGGSPDYSSEIKSIAPASDGLTIQVLDRDDRLLAINRTGKDVVIGGYSGEPYARLRADGTVEVNVHSPAYYLNEDRLGRVDVPASADERATPLWKGQDHSGRFEWHDHRIHWMGGKRPERVHDPKRRTKVFDWHVPIEVGGSGGRIAGTLYWVGRPSQSFPVGAAVALLLVVGGGALLVAWVRRRRASGGGDGPATPGPEPEAW